MMWKKEGELNRAEIAQWTHYICERSISSSTLIGREKSILA